MFDADIRKEILRDAMSKKRQKSFAESDRKAEVFIKKHWPKMNLDQVLEFLENAQKAIGHFPVSREITEIKFGTRL
jgi:DNA-binding FadR family transcriptional regulator